MAGSSDLYDDSGLDRIKKKLARLENPDPTPLLNRWCQIAVEDNRVKCLRGEDGDGKPLREVKYRLGLNQSRGFRREPLFGTTKHHFAGFGPHASGLHNNLTTAEYKRLTGPPLAPRREQSRVITNFVVSTPQVMSKNNDGGRYSIVTGWKDVVSVKGRPFLMAHFAPRRSWMPKRDLRGIRPEGKAKIKKALEAWVNFLLQGGTFE